jgi:hypothetical protein
MPLARNFSDVSGVRLHMKGFSRIRPGVAVGLAASMVAVVIWVTNFATPYHVPMIVDGAPPEFRILHVEKRGLSLHESEIFVFKDGVAFVRRDDRWLFQYRFQVRIARAVLPQELHERARAALQLPELSQLKIRPTRVLLPRNAEGWYIVLDRSQVLAFANEYDTSPPQQVRDVFSEIEKLQATAESPQTLQDACLGFCHHRASAYSRSD